ncbi:MAG TPA: xanthomonadin biosynthesis protein [Rhodanobacteraceae bacterium]|jgi:hypothetical protein
MPSAATPPTVAAQHPNRGVLPLLVCYAVLALLGGVLHQPVLGFVAIPLLLAALGLPVLRRRSGAGFALWLMFAALMIAAAASGHLQLAFSALPILILLALAALFARTLRSGREPLIARCIRVVEGEHRLALPGVAHYARGVTVYWACVLAVQAAILAVLLVCATPGGVLDAFGIVVPFAIPRDALAWYPEAGCWAVLALAFAAEYAVRRWSLRGIPHPPVSGFVKRLILRWPQLLHEEVTQ